MPRGFGLPVGGNALQEALRARRNISIGLISSFILPPGAKTRRRRRTLLPIRQFATKMSKSQGSPKGWEGRKEQAERQAELPVFRAGFLFPRITAKHLLARTIARRIRQPSSPTISGQGSLRKADLKFLPPFQRLLLIMRTDKFYNAHAASDCGRAHPEASLRGAMSGAG